MTNELTVEQILETTTPQVRDLIERILKVENEYQRYQNLHQLKDKENELCQRICKLIEQEVKE